MSYQSSGYTPCSEVQDKLDSYFSTCDASKHRDDMPVLNFLLSGENRQGVKILSQAVAPGMAKLRTVTLIYNQLIQESAVSQPGTDYACTATTQRGNLSVNIDIDPYSYFQIEEKIPNMSLRYACESPSDVFPDKLARMINTLMERIGTSVINQGKLLMGEWGKDVPFQGASSWSVTEGSDQWLKVNTTASGNLDPTGMARLESAINISSWCNRPRVFAGLDQWEYYKKMRAGCCATTGIDIGSIMQQYGYAVEFDRRVNLQVGTAYGWVVQPGALQIIHYNQNDNGWDEAAGIGPGGTNYIAGIIYDPVTGFPIDITMKDDCGTLHIILRGLAKLWATPDDIYPTGHHLAGVNHFAGTKATTS